MKTDTTTKTRIITLTDRPPVTIQEDAWPLVAQGDGESGREADPARRRQARGRGEYDTYTLRVRQHADGRAIVYGVRNAALAAWHQPAGGEDWRGGALVEAGADLAATIRLVGEAGGFPDVVIRECIADLPAVAL